MEVSKQSQKAGDGAQQIQAGTIIFNQGITEERVRNVVTEMIPQALEAYIDKQEKIEEGVRNVFEEMIPLAIKECTEEAHAIAMQRINRLEQEVIPRITAIEGALESFADPAFQKLLKKAQQSAAATEREDDYLLLSELLVCHVEKGEQRKNRAAIAKAIEIIDYIDNDALFALTLIHAIDCYIPTNGDIQSGLELLSELFSKLLYMEFPTGKEWLEHLDVLGAVRLGSFGHMRTFIELYPQILDGYVCIGINKNSDKYEKAVAMLRTINLSAEVFVPNILLDEYVRLPIVTKRWISRITVIHGQTQRLINEEERKVIEEILSLYIKDDILQQKVDAKFIEIWDTYDSLKELRLWWESISEVFDITQVGKILAHINAKRCDQSLPDII